MMAKNARAIHSFMQPIISPAPNRIVQTRLGWRFWLVTLAAGVMVLITAWLGVWQLSRAAQKQSQQAMLVAQEHMPALGASDLARVQAGGAGALLHRSVQLRGQWVPEGTVFLDNRQMQGQPGFWVLTPLRLQGGQGVVLVQRGWVPRDFQVRDRLPEVVTPAGDVQIHGRIAGAVARLYEFVPAAQGEGDSRIRQNLDVAAYGAQLGLHLLPLVVLQVDAASEGLLRDWAPIDSGVDKHYGYAFQWFGLCGLVFILYVWFQLVRRFSFLGGKSKA